MRETQRKVMSDRNTSASDLSACGCLLLCRIHDIFLLILRSTRCSIFVHPALHIYISERVVLRKPKQLGDGASSRPLAFCPFLHSITLSDLITPTVTQIFHIVI